MNKIETTGLRKYEGETSKEHFFDGQAYDMLDFGYHVTLLISGLCLLGLTHYLNWISGIGWVFLSRLISILMIRLDMTINGSKIVELQKLKSNRLFPYQINN